ncbi:MAG: hypothetical protein HFH47_01520 [Bacilli bacterium]|jgi:hypothetical protein|uniref:hypothetical protein n=1 Tax=uncultured Clostridium sp. TaxID=59620 RepID=UPI00260BA7AB|nr:hypothetical protein [uncultured Clostridium sp.]MCI9110473.1 hypothetical protein [Bacilli bacterium]
MKKLFCCILTFLFVLTINFKSTFASVILDPTIQQLKDLNDENWTEFLDNLNINSKNKVSGEIYMKVYETPNKLIMDDKTYTYDEYINESKNKANISNNTNWIKFFYSMYPQYNDSSKVGVIGGFQWLKTPIYQYTDIFTISSDGNLVIPGANERVNVAFWPNISCPSIVGSYTTGSSNIEFDTYGISGKFKLSSMEFANQITNTPGSEKYFRHDGLLKGFTTLGCPKGTIGFSIKRANSNTLNGKLGFTYNHRQVVLNFDPSVSVGSSGEVNLDGITGGMGYDTATSSISYNWGSFID